MIGQGNILYLGNRFGTQEYSQRGKHPRQGAGGQGGRYTGDVDDLETIGNNMDQSWDVSVRRQEGKLATNRRNTRTINTHTPSVKTHQGGD